MSNSCFFIGHRDSPAEIKPLLLQAIEKHITEYGVSDFYVGHHGNFDGYVAAALCEMKKRYPHIKAYLSLAYHPSIQKVDLPKGFDSTIYLEGQENSPPRYAITNRNKQMVRDVGYLIAYSRYITDGSHNLLNYAKAKEKKGQLVITNLADELSE